MAGHSKWANIKHKKGRADAKRSKLFSRIVKEIISAVKQGGADPKSNPKLRLAMQKARNSNLSSEVIARNIKKAKGHDQQDFTTLTYELYGHGGVGIIVDAMTDNKNRTASDIRIAINKKGGTIASPGSVAYNFEQRGIIQIAKTQADEERIFTLSAKFGVEDFDRVDEIYVIIVAPNNLFDVKERFESEQIVCLDASLEMVPKVWVKCSEEEVEANSALIEFLEGLDDVDAVFHNMQASN